MGKRLLGVKRELDFLGHHTSRRGTEPYHSKIARVLDWPTPTCAKHVRGFLGLVRYLAAFLPKLAEQTNILTPLTTKDAKASFPAWTNEHQDAFDSIKKIVTGADCLTVIDHAHPGDNKIFVTCDASEWRTGGPPYGMSRRSKVRK